MNKDSKNILIKSYKNLEIILLDKKSIPQLFHLLNELEISIAGLKSITIYKAICNDALGNDKVIITVAKEEPVY